MKKVIWLLAILIAFIVCGLAYADYQIPVEVNCTDDSNEHCQELFNLTYRMVCTGNCNSSFEDSEIPINLPGMGKPTIVYINVKETYVLSGLGINLANYPNYYVQDDVSPECPNTPYIKFTTDSGGHPDTINLSCQGTHGG